MAGNMIEPPPPSYSSHMNYAVVPVTSQQVIPVGHANEGTRKMMRMQDNLIG